MKRLVGGAAWLLVVSALIACGGSQKPGGAGGDSGELRLESKFNDKRNKTVHTALYITPGKELLFELSYDTEGDSPPDGSARNVNMGALTLHPGPGPRYKPPEGGLPSNQRGSYRPALRVDGQEYVCHSTWKSMKQKDGLAEIIGGCSIPAESMQKIAAGAEEITFLLADEAYQLGGDNLARAREFATPFAGK
jgi:hypothetical protein